MLRLPLLLSLSIFWMALPWMGNSENAIIYSEINQQASTEPLPNFSATTMNGRAVSTRDLKGKIIVMNFWFVACKPCIMEMPELNELVEEFKNDTSIVFLALANDSPTALESFLQKQKFTYQIIPNARTIAVESFKVSGYPTHIIADANGNVVYRSVGYSTVNKGEGGTVDNLRKKITELQKN